jgi:hypothetical protein
MALIEMFDKSYVKQVENKIKNDCIEFNQLSAGAKIKSSYNLYVKNRILEELGEKALDTIERISEEKNILEAELKEINNYDEDKLNKLLEKNKIIRKNNREIAKKELMKTISLIHK